MQTIFLSDPSGTIEPELRKMSKDIPMEIREFKQAAMLSATAAREGADLAIIAGPMSLAPLERLHNDPRTRGVPVLLIASKLGDGTGEQRFKAMALCDQRMDFPPEESVFRARVRQLLEGGVAPDGLLDFARARIDHEATAHWAGRITWVRSKALGFETDIELPEGLEIPLSGALVTAACEDGAVATVVACRSENVHYNHAVELELEIRDPHCNLARMVEETALCHAAMKDRIILVSENPRMLTKVAGAMDQEHFSLRWVKSFEDLKAQLARHAPALILVDIHHSRLDQPGSFGTFRRIPEGGPKVLPLEAPEETKSWERLGEERCPVLEPPDLDDKAAFREVVAQLAAERHASVADDRAFIDRAHEFSHGRITVPARMVELSEVSGGVTFEHRIHAGGRLQLNAPELERHGLRPFFARALRTTRAKQAAELLWMGIGGDADGRKLRAYVQFVIMEARRREYYESDMEDGR